MAEDEIKSLYSEVIEAVRQRLGQNNRIRRTLPDDGRIRIDRQLPFLCVYRSPADRMDLGTRELVTTEAAYLFASGNSEHYGSLVELCRSVVDTLQEHFGAFLLLEIWSEKTDSATDHYEPQPAFRIVTTDAEAIPTAVETLKAGLEDVKVNRRSAFVEIRLAESVAPPGLPSISAVCDAAGKGACFHVGLAVRPIYQDSTSGGLYPLVLQSLRQQTAVAIRKGVFAFAGYEKEHPDRHYESLGPTSPVKAASNVDQQLSDVSDLFDFLLQVTPVNADAAWKEFASNDFKKEPALVYRPLPYRPSQLKRRLFEIPVERVEDVTLAHLFHEKQVELDRQLTALRDIGTSNFRYSSLQLYGSVEGELLDLAKQVLKRLPPEARPSANGFLDASHVVAKANEHIRFYRKKLPDFDARVEVRDDIAAGIMVAKGSLLISRTPVLRSDRLEACLHHEVGTHLLTYFNGRQQPLRQLYAGLAGYEELQEGLAVLAEYLVGGLTPHRMRILAGRVVAVAAMINRETFSETFFQLHKDYGFSAKSAFTTTLRAYRGGGFTKDVIYMRGLRNLLEYLRQGHDVEPLYVGKIALSHVPFVQELRRRGIIQPPAAMPSFWNSTNSQHRLESCRGLSLLDLTETEK